MLVDKIGHIKNPLTVIAMFAAIAEISGTTVLPFIEPENQSIYIWFLMLFPIFLVGTFFLTLNLNHRVLYAPSDYKDEKNFVDPYGKATPEEQGRKLQEEVDEIEAEDIKEVKSKAQPSVASDFREKESSYSTSNNVVNPNRHRQLMADVTLAEKLSVNKISKELNINFKTDVRLLLPNADRSIVFDALGFNRDEIHAVEVKLFKAKYVEPSRLAKVFEQAELAANHFTGIDPKEFTLHVIAVMDSPNIETNMIKHRLNEYAKRYKIKVEIHVTSLDDLQNEYQYNL